MTFVVPFDGSVLSEAALARAVTFGDCIGARVVAVTVVPRNAAYAREHGWLPDGTAYDEARVRRSLRRQIRRVTPDADFRHVAVDRHAPPVESRPRSDGRPDDSTRRWCSSGANAPDTW